MKTTLTEFMYAQELPHILAAKTHLSRLKKKGHIFLKEDISCLEEYESFQLYFYLTSHSQSVRDAVPIPKKSFMWLINQKEHIELLKAHFESYYLDVVTDENMFLLYDVKYSYIGEEYVWMFQKMS